MPEGEEKLSKLKGAVFLKRIIDTSSLLSLVMNSGGAFPYEAAQYMLGVANGEIDPSAPPA